MSSKTRTDGTHIVYLHDLAECPSNALAEPAFEARATEAIGISYDSSLRLHYNLDAAIFSIAELFVEVRAVLEPTRVSDHE